MPRVLLGCLLACGASAAWGHPLAPALLEFREGDRGEVAVNWRRPLAEVPGPGPVPVLPAGCLDAGPHSASVEGTAIRERWTLACEPDALTGARVGARDLGPAGMVVRVVRRDGRIIRRLVLPADPLFVIPPVERPLDVVRAYFRLGMEHIAGGPDHLLFVFGLVLLAGSFRRVVATVTAFTVGHSVTLAAAVLGLVRVPTGPIEMAIAASVLVLAVELAGDPERPSLVRRRPWLMAGAFGLLHGLGFAAALEQAGLPSSDVPLALLAFNLGIEAGQLGFVGCVLGAARIARPALARLPRWGFRIPVYAMGSLAAFWWVARTVALWR